MPPTILIADDDESIRLLLTTLLEEAGYRTILAENGQAAVQLAVENRPDIAILDVMMPGLDGFETCRAIKSDQRTTDIPVLLLTALAQTPAKVQGLDCGASDYITKPFVANELLARLRTTLAQKSRHDALAAEALTDALTGLANRRSVEQQLDQMLAHSARSHETLSLLMFDADHFKIINDTYGHEVGDMALTALAQRAHTAMRAQDVVGRFGGEEFVAILPGTPRDAAMVAAERLRSQVESPPVPTSSGPVKVSVSVGVATLDPGRQIDRAALLAEADRALYSAKRAGRNCVVHADGQPAAAVPSEPPEAANALITALAQVHPPTAQHAHAVAEACWQISGALGLAATERSHITLAGLLHDIGKLSAAPALLDSAAPYANGEDESLRVHILQGEQLLRNLPTLSVVAPIVGAQLEWWDGSGHPHGLHEEQIPLGSRIVAVAHAYLRCRDASAHGSANLTALRREAGTHFDPAVVKAAVRLLR